MKQKKLSIRPYARLLTMLGEQLIKNERIALVELIKNSYDADADWVKVKFENFNDDMSTNKNSRIVVEDNGCGMAPEDIRNAWMNPATPRKYNIKKEGKRESPEKHRVMQGEKGIGRFAIFKLGKNITITTRTKSSGFESVLNYDFTMFDDDFTSENDKNREIFLDQIEVNYSEMKPPKLIKKSRGTVIEIRDLKGVWNQNIIKNLCKDISNLTDPISRIVEGQSNNDFQISIVLNGENQSVEDDSAETLKGLIENKSVLKIDGKFDSEKNAFVFKESGNNTIDEEIKLNNSQITGLWFWKKRFGKAGNNEEKIYDCGGFRFHFYIFDFSRGIPSKHELNQKQKNILKEHRIYLYRDGIRVYPYGDQDDDWLKIDVTRGIGRAGDFFSNDQIVGWVDISQKDNPDLKDKTNREGLIEQGESVSDFLFLAPLFLSYVKARHYSRYQQKQKDRNVEKIVRSALVANHLSKLKSDLEKHEYKTGVREVAKIEKEYKREKDYLVQRAETTEDLAGVGLSVEMASHDIMILMNRVNDIAKEIARLSRNSGDDKIQHRADMFIGVLDQVTDAMQDVQSLFKSAKRRRKNLRIEPIVDKIFGLYESLLAKRNIHYEKTVVPGSPLIADTTDGVVMQVFINLFDNAAYWLDTVIGIKKEIKVVVNGPQGTIIFSDNGPGINKEDLPYVFDAFYSGKGQEGRGLGLYIARQLLERHDYSISVVEREEDKLLSGANFIVSFFKEGD